ncbi:MAG TPA: TetR/AcrR family transcriptional regulator [Spirochaetota bacterium]|nr:TetR/AcrR family transcriptional regulator [Spirochaetota bacterium]HPJ37965.1 TetR/AcrR family transcriptional regulator [Spirochaetota bacterium]HPQ54250.1 TetR/AcrR family transcriptional regulator [Spirochaetota bacterium]
MDAEKAAEHSYPPGRIKISEALKKLLGNKDFQAIKIAEIAETAGVNEALIYKYFKNKRDLLYHMIGDYLEECRVDIIRIISMQKSALAKLDTFVSTLIDIYNRDRVYSKMILFEFRNSSDYYVSKPYEILQGTYDLCLDILKEGIADGTFRKDINPCFMRQHIIGSVEQVCMNSIITARALSSKKMTAYIIDLLVNGISSKTN